MYLFSRHIDSARFNPIAFTRMRTCPSPASGTSTFLNLNTSGPPAFENSTTRDIENPPLPTLVAPRSDQARARLLHAQQRATDVVVESGRIGSQQTAP